MLLGLIAAALILPPVDRALKTSMNKSVAKDSRQRYYRDAHNKIRLTSNDREIRKRPDGPLWVDVDMETGDVYNRSGHKVCNYEIWQKYHKGELINKSFNLDA